LPFGVALALVVGLPAVAGVTGVSDGAVGFSLFSNGNGTHFCLPFLLRVLGVFGCDVAAGCCCCCSSAASARLGQSLG